MLRKLTIGALMLTGVAYAADEVSPDTALQSLEFGNARYRRVGALARQRADTAQSQSPEAVVVSCSDSRVPPEAVFDRGIGQLFVVRTAGEVVGDYELASIEYAVEHLHVPLIVVMGHERCGAVKAAIEAKPGETGGDDHIGALVAFIAPAVAAARKAPGGDLLAAAVRQEARHVVTRILAESAVVRDAADQGQVKIVAAVYDLDTGAVEQL
jgi:carbonic anhydrase